MQCCLRRSTPERFGRSRAALPVARPPTSAILPNPTFRGATISTAAATLVKRRSPRSRGSSSRPADQVTFMEGLMQPDRVRARILLWAEEETQLSGLPPKASAVLEAILYRGELPRGDVAVLLGLTPRHARRIVSDLLKRGVLISKGPRDPLYLAFPAALASRWMPGLFPDQV